MDDCNFRKFSDMCLYGNNAFCAYKQYQYFDKTWSYWEDEAVACGCEV